MKFRIQRFVTKNYDYIMGFISVVGTIVSLVSFFKIEVASIFATFLVLLPIVCCYIVIRMILRKIRDTYYRVIDNNPQYYRWHIKVMKRLYGEDALTNVFGQVYTNKAVSFDSIESVITQDTLSKYNGQNIKTRLLSSSNIRSLFPGVNYWLLRLKYWFIVEHTIKFSHVPGYMLDRYDSNKKTLYCTLGTYRQNVYTSFILEFELYRAFQHIKKAALNSDIPVPKDILEQLPYRKRIHQKCGNDIHTILTTGIGRFSLMSVQMLIVYYSETAEKYKILLKKRSSNHVSSKLNYYQFVPAGGFDMCEKEQEMYNLRKIQNGCNLKTVLYREFLEELFNQTDFQGIYDDPGNTDPENRIYGSKQIKLINSLIDGGHAQLCTLGAAVDLVTLRHNISYALVVGRDGGEFEREIISNIDFNDEFSPEDGDIDRIVDLEKVGEIFNDHKSMMITSDSAVLYKLFIDSPIYKQLKQEQFDNEKIIISIYNADKIHISKR